MKLFIKIICPKCKANYKIKKCNKCYGNGYIEKIIKVENFDIIKE